MAASFKYNTDQLHSEAVDLLKQLISTQSISREEDKTADLIQGYFEEQEVPTERKGNNVWVKNQDFDDSKPTVLLNSHHDTVKPNAGYTRDPFYPSEEDGKLFGLGSNDAGGALVSLIMTFMYFYTQKDLKYNLILAATAEEEISGPGEPKNFVSSASAAFTISWSLVIPDGCRRVERSCTSQFTCARISSRVSSLL